jgi:glycosidase
MVEFKPTYEAFPTPDIFKDGDACLDAKYWKMSDQLFGTINDMEQLVKEFKEAIQREGLIVPGKLCPYIM